jgi:glycerol-3-phosphate O-acyltransferase
LPHVALVDHVARLTRLVRRLGARTSPSLTRGPAADLREGAVRDAALLYVRGGLVRQHVPGDTLTGDTGDDVIYTVPDDQRILLDIPKNTIIHLFVDRALVSVSLLAPAIAAGSDKGAAIGKPTQLARAELKERVLSLSRLFKLEFMFRADAPFDTIFDETLDDMARAGDLSVTAASVAFGPGHEGLDGRGWITFYASVVRNFVESYRVAARAVRVLAKAPLTEAELVQKALRIGEQMFLGAEIERAEAVSQPVLENAFAAFVEQGYLTRTGGKLALAPSFSSDEAAQGIEAKIASYLGD